VARIYSPYGGMIHLNGNLLCAVDVETTGVTPGFNDLIQISILPLNSDIKPLKSVPPFYMNLTPQNIENIDYKATKITKLGLAELMLNSMHPDKVQDLFMEWFEKLNLPVTPSSNKKLCPLWSNGSFDKSWILHWLGRKNYDHVFHFHERDTQALALSINDRFYHHGEKLPFPKVGLNYLASCFGIVNENAHDALADCVTTAEVYRRMLLMYQPLIAGAPLACGPAVTYGKGMQTDDSLKDVPAKFISPCCKSDDIRIGDGASICGECSGTFEPSKAMMVAAH
jgi:DNA polymerase III epsilon subunit-like protein